MLEPIPVVVLARLAVARAYQGLGVGRPIFRDGSQRVVQAAHAMGIRGIVVHAISEEAKRFYLALGLDPSPLDPMTLVVTLTFALRSRNDSHSGRRSVSRGSMVGRPPSAFLRSAQRRAATGLLSLSGTLP